MSLDMERLIPVNFATVEDLQRIPHVGPKVACAIITLRESHGNLTLDTLQTFLRVKFNAETLEMLDFTRNVGLPVLQLPHEQFDFEGGEEAGLEERQSPISPAPCVFKDPFEMKPRTSVKAEAVEERGNGSFRSYSHSDPGSFRSYSLSVRSFRPWSFRPDFRGGSFRPNFGGSFRPTLFYIVFR